VLLHLQVYFVGNAPMAHMDIHSSSSVAAAGDSSSAASDSSSSSEQQLQEPPAGRVFFHLAQVTLALAHELWLLLLSGLVASALFLIRICR
jgi:hypothetical protein